MTEVTQLPVEYYEVALAKEYNWTLDYIRTLTEHDMRLLLHMGNAIDTANINKARMAKK